MKYYTHIPLMHALCYVHMHTHSIVYIHMDISSKMTVKAMQDKSYHCSLLIFWPDNGDEF